MNARNGKRSEARQAVRTIGLAAALTAALVLPRAWGADRGIKVADVLGEGATIPVYHALIIGINDYQYWQHLREARQDAEKAAQVLKDSYGFKDVRTLYDRQATRQAIIGQLRDLTKKLGQNDALLIYYSGHGYYDKLLDNGYWIPCEAHEQIGNDPATTDWIQDLTLKDILAKMEARHVLVVSDACFSGALLRGSVTDLAAKENTWYRRAIAQPSRWCITSGDLEPVPDESVFASKFVEILRYPRKVVFSASDVGSWLKDAVAAETGRRPVFGPMHSKAGNDMGEFVFLSVESPAQVPTPAAGQPAGQGKVTTGTLQVNSPLAGTVTVNNGKPAEISPSKPFQTAGLMPGVYVVQVAAGLESWQGYVEIRGGQTASVSAMFPGVATPPSTQVAMLPQPGPSKLIKPEVTPSAPPPAPFRPAPGGGPQPGSPWQVPGLGMEFVWVANLNCWVGKYEVTNGEYRKMKPDHASGVYMGQSFDGERQPVVEVSYDDAVAFAHWLTDGEQQAGRLPQGWAYRLATGLEWLKIARCGENMRTYPWGEKWPPEYGNFGDKTAKNAFSSFTAIPNYDDGTAATCPVENSGSNAWGIYGLAGNAWEWTSEESHSLFRTLRTVRGGSWDEYHGQRFLECDYHDAKKADTRERDIGFRLVLGPVTAE